MPKWDSEAARSNLLSRSREQDDFETAGGEWLWSGDFIDHGLPAETCELCTHSGLRYHYKIVNTQTGTSLWVGSDCILRFDIAVYGDDGELLEGKTKQKKLDDKIREARINQALEPLRELWPKVGQAEQGLVRTRAKLIKEQRAFSPGELLSLFNQLTEHGIAYDPRLYKVTLRSERDKHQLLGMSEADCRIIWDSLADRQKETYEALKAQAEERASRRESFRQARIAAEVQAEERTPVAPLANDPRPTGSTPPPEIAEPDISVPPRSARRPPEPVPHSAREITFQLPVNYNERAHRFAIVFRGPGGQLLANPIFRGSEEFCRRFIEREIGNYPAGTRAEILISSTNEVIYQREV